jgi:hypothetical protein
VLREGELSVENSPVPQALLEDTSSPQAIDDRNGVGDRMKATVSRSRAMGLLKRLAFAVRPWEPFPEYRDAQSEAWMLMAAILSRFHEQVSPRPFVIVPVFYDSYVRFHMARNYWDRFSSLVGVHVIDLLGHFRQLGSEAVRCFQAPHDCHFSSYGHVVVADVLQNELRERQLLQ